MKKLLTLSLLLLSACNGEPNIFEVLEPTTGCLGPYYVKNGQGTLNHDKLLKNETVLKWLFTHPWTHTFDGGFYVHEAILPDDKAFCMAFGGVHVTYEWTSEFQCGNVECWGHTSPFKGIYLEYSGNSLAHELIHVYEGQNGIFNTGSHPDWDIKGYYYLNDVLWDYQREVHTLTGPDGGLVP